MTIYLTEAGRIHLAQLLDNVAVTNNFAVCEFGTGNTPTSTTDTRAAMLNKVVTSGTLTVEAGYPRQSDPDAPANNVGGGANVFTYKFLIPAATATFVATNFHITIPTPTATSPVMVVGTGLSISHVAGVQDQFYVNLRVF